MDNELFMNTELPAPEMAVHFEQPSSSSAMLNWAALMDPNLAGNSSAEDCFLWEKSTEQQSIFDSALSSLVSSPTPSNSNGDGFIIRELIGKLGNIGNSPGETYGTPMTRNTPLTEFSGDPGFAERAARFSCFGSRSFNGRTNGGSNSGKLTRVSSTPALKALVSPEFASSASRPMIPAAAGEFSRKRKSVPKGKSKESPLSTASPSPSFSKVLQFPGKVSNFLSFPVL